MGDSNWVRVDLIQPLVKLMAMRITSTLVLTMVGVAFTLAGDVYLKRSEGFESPKYLALGILLYLFGCIPVVFVFKITSFSEVFLAWEAMTVTLAVILGHFLFGESITPSKLAALVLVIAAIGLIGR